MIGVSSCLAGIKCTYRGGDNLIDIIQKMVAANEAIMICPEVLGGLKIPRNPCEIIDGRVIDNTGYDRSEEYELGAKKALDILLSNDVDVVSLKAKSPSCGKGLIYDGSFSHQLVVGNGITCQLLQENGIVVFNENEIEEFLEYIGKRS